MSERQSGPHEEWAPALVFVTAIVCITIVTVTKMLTDARKNQSQATESFTNGVFGEVKP